MCIFRPDVELFERKGVFCYDYLDSFARLDEPALPPRDAFINKLGGVECSQVDYAHTQNVWDNFHWQNLEEYMALYLLSDICLLADVFQAFRNNSLYEYQLNPEYFVSAPNSRGTLFSKTHWPADPANYRPGYVSYDPAEHLQRYLPRKRPLGPRKTKQVNWLAIRLTAAHFVHHGGRREQF